MYYAVIGVAIASLTDRRIVAGAAIIGLFLVTSIASGILVGDDFELDGGSPAALINVLALPLYLRDLVFLGHVDPTSPLAGVDNGGLLAVVAYVVVLLVGVGRAAAPLPVGGALMSPPRPTAATAAPRPGVRRRRDRRGRRRVGVVRAEGRAVRAELLVRPGRHRPARTERRRQDDADAGDHRPRRRQPGHGARSRAATRAATAACTAGWRWCPRTRRCPAGSPPASSCATSPTSTASPTATRPTTRCDGRRCSTSPTGASTAFSKGMRQRTKVAAALVTDPQVLVLDEPLNGADPVQRVHLIALFKRLGAEGRTVIVSSHVLNEVERLAERVIVLIHGRLAAAGGHRAIRDAMDDRPRHVLVRSDDGRRLAAAGRARLGRRRDVRPDARRARRSRPCRPASWRPRCRGSPATRRSGCSRSARSTTRSRACSGSSCDDRADAGHDRRGRGRGSSPSSSTRCSRASRRKRWAAVLLPCAGALLFGLLAHAVDDTAERAFANVAAEGIFGLVDADRRARHRRRRARRRGARRHVPLHVAVAGADVADRARALARRLARRRSSRSPRPCALAAVVAGAPGERRRRRSSPPPSAASSYVAVFIAIGCLTRRTAVWSLAFVFLVERLLGAALTGIAQLSPTWESRAIFVGLLDDPPSRLVRDGIPQGGAAVVRLRDRDRRRAGRRQLADGPHAPVRRLRLTGTPDIGARHWVAVIGDAVGPRFGAASPLNVAPRRRVSRCRPVSYVGLLQERRAGV